MGRGFILLTKTGRRHIIELTSQYKSEDIGMKQKIIEAAALVFSRKGYFTASVDDIAEAAGAAKGSLYYHFKSKSRLYIEVLRYGVKMLIESIGKAADTAGTTKDVFAKIMDIHVKMYLEFPEMASVFFKELSIGLEPEVLSEVDEIKEEYTAHLIEIIKDGQRWDMVKSGDARLIAAALKGMMSGVCSQYIEKPMGIPKEEVIDFLTQMTFSGIATEG